MVRPVAQPMQHHRRHPPTRREWIRSGERWRASKSLLIFWTFCFPQSASDWFCWTCWTSVCSLSISLFRRRWCCSEIYNDWRALRLRPMEMSCHKSGIRTAVAHFLGPFQFNLLFVWLVCDAIFVVKYGCRWSGAKTQFLTFAATCGYIHGSVCSSNWMKTNCHISHQFCFFWRTRYVAWI